MELNAEKLEDRRHQLVISLQSSMEFQIDLKERLKDIREEISNTKGAVLELNRILGVKDEPIR